MKGSQNRQSSMEILIILAIFSFALGCSTSSSLDNSVMTFEVTMFNNLSIDEYAKKNNERFYPITITLIDYEPESEITGTVDINTIGSLSFAHNSFGIFDGFTVRLDSSFFPYEFFSFTNLKIEDSEMSGIMVHGGSLLDLFKSHFPFIASRKK